MADSQLEITQVKSLIGATARQRATVAGLGLKRIHHTVVQPDRKEIRGMVAAVSHLVRAREVTPRGTEREAGGQNVPSAGGPILGQVKD